MRVSLLLSYCLHQAAEDECDMIRSGESEPERLRGREQSCMIIITGKV